MGSVFTDSTKLGWKIFGKNKYRLFSLSSFSKQYNLKSDIHVIYIVFGVMSNLEII